MQNIALIGSTGNIGTQALDVIRENPGRWKITALACYGNIDLLEKQAREFLPEIIAVYNPEKAKILQKRLAKNPVKKIPAAKKQPAVLSGGKGWEKASTHQLVNKVVFASSGVTALNSIKKAIKSGKQIALANKEVIVEDGEKIMTLAKKNKVAIIPIDSEHSAIFQCLQGEDPAAVEKIILTCSGGPFYGRTKQEIQNIKVKDALKHPNWKMGEKITIDCATLMNKGFEIIEAKHLFGIDEDKIEVIIHPQSIVHSFVQFKDGSVKAQLAEPDMKIPIAYALSYPQRLKTKHKRLNMEKLNGLTFIKPDFTTFTGPVLARRAIKIGGRAPAGMLRTNDFAVGQFLKNKISFTDIFKKIESVLDDYEKTNR